MQSRLPETNMTMGPFQWASIGRPQHDSPQRLMGARNMALTGNQHVNDAHGYQELIVNSQAPYIPGASFPNYLPFRANEAAAPPYLAQLPPSVQSLNYGMLGHFNLVQAAAAHLDTNPRQYSMDQSIDTQIPHPFYGNNEAYLSADPAIYHQGLQAPSFDDSNLGMQDSYDQMSPNLRQEDYQWSPALHMPIVPCPNNDFVHTMSQPPDASLGSSPALPDPIFDLSLALCKDLHDRFQPWLEKLKCGHHEQDTTTPDYRVSESGVMYDLPTTSQSSEATRSLRSIRDSEIIPSNKNVTQTFICPFAAKDFLSADIHCWVKLTSISYLKDHLRTRHIQSPKRSQMETPPSLLLTDFQQAGIRIHEKRGASEEQWERIYRIIFPQEPKSPSPYLNQIVKDWMRALTGFINREVYHILKQKYEAISMGQFTTISRRWILEALDKYAPTEVKNCDFVREEMRKEEYSRPSIPTRAAPGAQEFSQSWLDIGHEQTQAQSTYNSDLQPDQAFWDGQMLYQA